MQEATHIINKVFFEVNTNSSKKAFALKDNLSVFLKRELFPAIERYFDKQNRALSDITLRFDKIEIEINQADITDLGNLKHIIFEKLKNKVDLEIQNATSPTEDQNKLVVLSKNKSRLDAFIYFLQTGSKPWWQNNISRLFDVKGIETIITETAFSSRFFEVLAFKVARQRLINQFSDNVLVLLLSTINSEKTSSKYKIFSTLQRSNAVRKIFWETVIDAYRYSNNSKVENMLNKLKANKSIDLKELEILENFASIMTSDFISQKKKINVPIEKDDPLTEDPEVKAEKVEVLNESQYINNAGLVLMHPFLKQFFINAKLADSKGSLIQSKKEVAVHLLHYLCTKKEQQLESELVLEKFLCGYPLNKTMQRFIVLSDELKQMAEEVLQSAITHWKALKNTSPDGLRTGFLQREGKLMVENNACKIIVERKAQDVLLDKLPWNIHILKLPWRDDLIFVEW